MSWTLYAIAALITLSAFVTISVIGKERKPITPGVAAAVVLIDAAMVVALVIAAGRVS